MKQKLTEICDRLLEVAKRGAVEYGDTIPARLEVIKKSIADYAFRIYLVGPFSCGKSSLLNRWLRQDILSTGPAPETGVSTELHYGSGERMLLQPLDDKRPVEELHGLTDVNMGIVRERANNGELANVVLYANNPSLKRYPDLCLVDLPGLSSAKPAHEAAILRFVREPRRVAVFCLPMDAGTIKDDERQFLQKMDSFGSEYKVLLTKADLRPSSDHADIVAGVRADIQKAINRDVSVSTVSQDSIDAFEKMLDDYVQDKDLYLLNRFRDEIARVAEEMSAALRRIAFHDYRDNAAVEDALDKLEKTMQDLPSITKDVQTSMLEAVGAASSDIMHEVRKAVEKQTAGVSVGSRPMISSGEIASIIQSTIAYCAPRKMQDIVEDVHVDRVLDNELDVPVDSLAASNLPVAEPASQVEVANPTGDGKSMFGSVAETLSIGATVLEVAEFMPVGGPFVAIAGLVGAALFQRKKEQEERSRREAEYARQMEEAISQTRPQIDKLLSDATERYAASLQTAAAKRLEDLQKQMNELKMSAAAERDDWERKQQTCRAELAAITEILSGLE